MSGLFCGKDLKKRLPIAIGLLAFGAFLFLGFENFFVTWLTFLFIATLSLGGLFELVGLFEAKGCKLSFFYLGPWLFLLLAVDSAFVFENSYPSSWPLKLLVLCSFFVATLLLHMRKIEGALFRMAGSFASMVYIAFPIGLLCELLFSGSLINGVAPKIWVTYLILVVKIGDMAGYFGGKLLGSKKMAPILSPKKTWMGAFCHALIPTLIALPFASILNLSFINAGLLTFFLALFGILGDLVESMMKRDAALKDSGHLLGSGGVLDFLDSLLLPIPLLVLYLRMAF